MNAYYKAIHSALVKDDPYLVPPFPPEATDNDRWLFRHIAVVAWLLMDKEERYRELLARWESEGPTEELRADALFEAGALALVLQSARRRPEVIVAASETPLKPTLALGLLDQLFYSFTLLTAPSADDDYVEARLSSEELDEFLEFPNLKQWFREIGLWEGGAPGEG